MHSGRLQTNQARRSGMTLIEVLAVILIIAVLIGLLMPAFAIIRTKAHQAEAAQTVRELLNVLELYRRDHPRRHYPVEAADQSIGAALLTDLDDRGLWSKGNRQRDEAGRLLDPWMQPYRYSLTRPAPAVANERLATWNWDVEAGHEARWGARRNAGSGATVDGPLPYPYLWSLGRKGATDDARTWIFTEDGK